MALTKVIGSGIGTTASLADSNMPAGSVLQTLYLANATTTATTSTSFAGMGGSNLAITPSSSSNKILIQYNYHIYVINGDNNTWRGGLVRLMNITGDAVLQTDTNYGVVLYSVDGGDRSMGYANGSFLHSPSTTSAITYGLECASALAGKSATFNNTSYGRGGYITLQEIAV